MAKRSIQGAPSKFYLCTHCGLHTDRTRKQCTTKNKQHTTHADKLLGLLASGISQARACAEAGILTATLHDWKNKGEDAHTLQTEGYTLTKKEQDFLGFLERYARANERLATDTEVYIGTVMRQAREAVQSGALPPVDLKEALAVLERLDKTRWGRHLTVQHEGEAGGMIDRFSDAIATLIEGILDDLELTAEQRKRAPGIVKDQLEQVTARGEAHATEG